MVDLAVGTALEALSLVTVRLQELCGQLLDLRAWLVRFLAAIGIRLVRPLALALRGRHKHVYILLVLPAACLNAKELLLIA